MPDPANNTHYFRCPSHLAEPLRGALNHLLNDLEGLRHLAKQLGVAVDEYDRLSSRVRLILDNLRPDARERVTEETLQLLKTAAILFQEHVRGQIAPAAVRAAIEATTAKPLDAFANLEVDPHSILEDIRQARAPRGPSGPAAPTRAKSPIGFA